MSPYGGAGLRSAAAPLSVGVAGTSAVAGAAPALGPRGQVRTLYVDGRHGAVPELLVEAADQGGCEQGELGGPGGRVGADHEPALGERLGRAVGADVGADQVRPPREHAADPQLELPPAVRDQPLDLVSEQLGVAVVRVGAGDLRVDRPALALAAPAGCRSG